MLSLATCGWVPPPGPQVLPSRPPTTSFSQEAALYSKALAKRQRALIRFGEVAVITSPQLAPHTVRVFECAL